MSSTFKNRIPKRKYRERVQPQAREQLGFLQKKKDYKIRAENYHGKQKMLDKFKLKASTKNEDEFYFKMIKAKKNQDGKHYQEQEMDDDFDENKYKAILKTQNYSLALSQRAIVQNKIERLRGILQMIGQTRPRSHKIFTNDAKQFEEFEAHKYYKTTKQLADNSLLEVNPQDMSNQKLDEHILTNENLKHKYNRLAEYEEKQQILTKLIMKLSYEKNLLTKERKKIKKFGKNGSKKIHKFFLQRKK